MKERGYWAVILGICLFGGWCLTTSATRAKDNASASDVDRGRYVVKLGGCNDCHTDGYSESDGQLAQSKWLTGKALGWKGPWGTTYATNLRLYFHSMDVDTWVKTARAMHSRPPMPSFVFREMTDSDLRAMYTFVHSLGSAGAPAPSYLPPGQPPATPAIVFPMPPTH